MKVIKPQKLGVVTRCFEHERRSNLGISILAFIPLDDTPALLSEVGLWTFVAERMGADAVIEAGMPKSRGEFVVHGSCFAPKAVPQPKVPVRVQVGDCERTLLVHGDRYWKPGRTPSEPQPFTELPLDWSVAYGGPRFKRNPLGRGHGESEYLGQRVQMLPNVEDPEALVVGPRDQPDPVGLGAMDIAWPQRQQLAGTYDKRWLESAFPGLAHDVDWRMFNLAQPAQHIDGFWAGDESIELDNLHPTEPRLRARLPDLAARAFITRPGTTADTTLPLEEVELSLRTLWLFPDVRRAVLVYQGSAPVEHHDGTDVGHLVLAAEHRCRPRPAEHYAAVLESRLDEDTGAIASLREHELLPADLADAVEPSQAREQALHHTERRLEHNLHRRALQEHEASAAQLREQGLDPAAFGLEPPAAPAPSPTPDELPGVVEDLKERAELRRVEEMERFEQSKVQRAALLQTLGLPAEEQQRLASQHEQGPTGPPTFTAQGQHASLAALVEQLRANGTPTESLEQMLADPTLHGQWAQAETQLRDNYRKTAHLQDPAAAMDPTRTEEARACVRETAETGGDFSTLDLTGADLSGMDLRGANLSGAFWESTILDGADLRDTDLRGAVLAHGSLVRARLDGANLEGANLGRSTMTEASLASANLVGAELMGADLSMASLRGADLREAGLFQAILTDADASDIRTEQLTLIEAEVTGLILVGARLPRAVFVRLDLAGCDLSRADLSHASFVACSAAGVRFIGTTLDHARFVDTCSLSGADLTGAHMHACNLRGTTMDDCTLTGAQLDGADLSQCVMPRANLHRAVARGTRFDGADLREASLLAANFMHASFLGATIHGVDLRDSNLHGADMARVRSDDRVRLEDAILTKVRIHPLHPSKAP